MGSEAIIHLFGNGPSPAVATYGLRRTVDDGEEHDPGVNEFVQRNVYVDDGLISKPTAEEVVTLVRNTPAALASANLRPHKVMLNSVSVMEAFPTEDLAKDIRSLDLHQDDLPAQRSFGVLWDQETDAFTYKLSIPDKPLTRRGVLSVVNSVYDHLGLAAPVLLQGRLLLQQLVSMGEKKTATAPEELSLGWKSWKNALPDLQNISIQRCYHPPQFGPVTRAELHAFSDASQTAIGVAVYLLLFNCKEDDSVSLLFEQAKVAPINPIRILRLELCGAVLAVQAVDRITEEIDMEISETVFYTDSKVVLGYCNESRRFHIYVANRVQTITLRVPSILLIWLRARGLHPKDLAVSSWLSGPDVLRNPSEITTLGTKQAILSPNGPELRKKLKPLTTSVKSSGSPTLGTERFKKHSSWPSLRRAIAILIAKVKSLKERDTSDKPS